MIITLFFLFFSQFMLLNVKAQSTSGPYLILFDEGHDQYYTYSNGRFKTALDYLNQTADFEVFLNSGELNNYTKLLRYDFIIIGNPGPNGNFSVGEIKNLTKYVDEGGNLFLLSNYHDVGVAIPDENITGQASYLNNITQELNLPVSFTYYDLWTNDTHIPLGPRWITEIEDSNFQDFHPISRKIKTVLIFSSGLNVTQNQDIIATGYSHSYLRNQTNDKIYETPWLYATQQGTSRIILCGSTIIFSDLNVTDSGESSYVGVPWIEAVDNLRLWANLIQWTIITEIPTFFNIFIIIIILITAVGIGLYLYHAHFTKPKSPLLEVEKQNLLDERAMVLKEARSRITEGMHLAAVQLYKQAVKLSNKLKDYRSENLYTKKYRELLQSELAMVLKSARNNVAEGKYNAAAQLYKQASKISKNLGDYKGESLHNEKYRKYLAKSKEK